MRKKTESKTVIAEKEWYFVIVHEGWSLVGTILVVREVGRIACIAYCGKSFN